MRTIRVPARCLAQVAGDAPACDNWRSIGRRNADFGIAAVRAPAWKGCRFGRKSVSGSDGCRGEPKNCARAAGPAVTLLSPLPQGRPGAVCAGHDTTFDDFAGAGADRAANRRMPEPE
jgi:hypothetical protein